MSEIIWLLFSSVNNFQTITEELVRKQESLDQSEELARMKEELNWELHKHDNRMNKARCSMGHSHSVLRTENLHCFHSSCRKSIFVPSPRASMRDVSENSA